MFGFRKALGPAVVMAVLVMIAGAVAGNESPTDELELGRRIYWDGITPSGSPLHATLGGDIQITGTQFSCVNCHRPSGFGTSEGGKYVPPISSPILFSPRQLDRNRIYKKLFEEAQPAGFAAEVRQPRMRPAYTNQTLAEALRDGVDPSGRTLDPQMPRFDLDDQTVGALATYLRTLSASFSPGVDSQDIHFATVVSDDTDESERVAVIKTISAFFDWMNRATVGYENRPGFSPYHMSELASAFRHWRLHVWELHGPHESWPDQIERQYATQPVFAVVSGLVDGPWLSIAEFCDANRVPCIFPNTELPRTTDEEYDYSIYFSGGLTLEGEALARFIREHPQGKNRIALIYSNDPYGKTPVGGFRRLITTLLPDASVRQFEFTDQNELNAVLKEIASADKEYDAMILWPGDQIDVALTELAKQHPEIPFISLPSAALSEQKKDQLAGLADTLRFVYPYELPSAYHPRAFRVRKWMHAQHLDITHPRLQFQTYYAMTMVQFALDQIVDDFYRDYFIEAIEHLSENNLNVGTHPTLALGPGQRFASKGAYIVRIDPESPGGISAVSNWIVP